MGSDPSILARGEGLLVEAADFEGLLRRLDGLDGWLAANGVRRTGSDRLAAYVADIRALAEASCAGTPALDSLWKQLGPERLCNSLVEGSEWADIFDAFGTVRGAEIAARLRDCVKGPALYREERAASSSNRARDIQAEFAAAAHLRRSGIAEIIFSSGGDFSFPLAGTLVYVQGKRIASDGQVKKRVREAQKQLDRDYRRGLECVGLIAISISKLVNPAGNRPHVDDWPELDALLRRAPHEFIARHERHWHTGDTRTLGALVMFRCGAYVQEAPWFSPAECLSFAYRTDIGGDRLGLARRLRGVLDRGKAELPGLPQPAPTTRGRFRQPLRSGSPTS